MHGNNTIQYYHYGCLINNCTETFAKLDINGLSLLKCLEVWHKFKLTSELDSLLQVKLFSDHAYIIL